jgi:hypothetical protein
MPTLYLDRPFNNAVSDHAEKLERHRDDDVRVTPKGALFDMLKPEFQEQIRRRRDDYNE